MDKLGPYELNRIYIGDARELSKVIPDESVDLIFTDPVYDRIEDYEWLAREAIRVLKPNGHILTYVTQEHLPLQLGAMSVLNWAWLFSIFTVGRQSPIWRKKIQACGTLLAWHFKDGLCHPEWISDFLPATILNGKFYKWNKFKNVTIKFVVSFTMPGDIIFDPFTGWGTCPIVCKILNRNYLAFEIDPEVAETARHLVAQTQPPLPQEMQPKQVGLFDENMV